MEHFQQHEDDKTKYANGLRHVQDDQKEKMERIVDLCAINCISTVQPYSIYRSEHMKNFVRALIDLCDGRLDHVFENTWSKLNRYKMQRAAGELADNYKKVSYLQKKCSKCDIADI